MELKDKETSTDGMQHLSVSLPWQPSYIGEEHSLLDTTKQKHGFATKKTFTHS